MKNLRKAILPILFCLVTGSTLYALVNYNRPLNTPVVVVRADTVGPAPIDSAGVALFKTLAENFNLNRKEVEMEAVLNAADGADTVERLNHTRYIFSKKGSSFYIRIGDTESINAEGVHVFVDHENRKILLAPEKQTAPVPAVPGAADLVKMLTSEGFQIVRGKSGTRETIALVNPYHLSCKEYRIGYDAHTLIPGQLHLRLSNGLTPEDRTTDNVVDMDINYIRKNVTAGLISVSSFVTRVKKEWLLTEKYKDYTLINTL